MKTTQQLGEASIDIDKKSFANQFEGTEGEFGSIDYNENFNRDRLYMDAEEEEDLINRWSFIYLSNILNKLPKEKEKLQHKTNWKIFAGTLQTIVNLLFRKANSETKFILKYISDIGGQLVSVSMILLSMN